jgi:hypothetical protein
VGFSRNINTYTDVARVFETARQNGGLRYELPTPGHAINWRARAYYYRHLISSNARERAGNPPGFKPTTAWDDITLTTEGCDVIIRFGVVAGKMKNLAGEEVQPAKITGLGEAERIIAETDGLSAPKEEEDALSEAETIAAALKLL